MNLNKCLFLFLISLSVIITQGKIISESLNKKYCELEKRFCKTIPHVGCNQSHKGFEGTIINLNENIKIDILYKINTFRNDLAQGLLGSYKSASKMRLLEWSKNLESVAKLLLQFDDEKFCTSTKKNPYTTQIMFRIANFTKKIGHQLEFDEIFDKMLLHFSIEDNKINSLVRDSSNEIGCAIGKEKSTSGIRITCVLNLDPTEKNNDLYEKGKPCEKCNSFGEHCDTEYNSLCTLENSNTRIKRGIEPSQKGKKPNVKESKDMRPLVDIDDNDEDDDDLDDDEDEDEDYEDDEASTNTIKDYGAECQYTEECNWPLVCEETEHEDGSKIGICSCDESYYYYDSVIKTCLLDGYDIIDYVKQLVEDLKNSTVARNNIEEKTKSIRQSQNSSNSKKDLQKNLTTINNTTKPISTQSSIEMKNEEQLTAEQQQSTTPQPIIIEKIVHKDDTLIVIIVTCVLFVITWIFVIVFIRRLENSIDRKLGDNRQFSDNRL